MCELLHSGVRKAFLLLVLCAIFPLILWTHASEEASLTYSVCSYWRDDIRVYLKRNGLRLDSVWDLKRAPSADGLLVYGFASGVPTCVEIGAGTEKLRAQALPSINCWLGQDRNPVAWREPKGIVRLRNGEHINLPPFAVFNVDPGGEYFVLGERRRSWIGRIDDASSRELISLEMLGVDIFSSSNRVYVCGLVETAVLSTGQAISGARCMVLEITGGGYKLLQQRDFPWAAGVVDMVPTEEKLLVQAKAKLSPKLFVCDLKSGERVRAGTAKALNLLLVRDPLTGQSSRGEDR